MIKFDNFIDSEDPAQIYAIYGYGPSFVCVPHGKNIYP